jgi:hypothetical protein
MTQALARLDELGEFAASAHLAMAIWVLERDYSFSRRASSK